MEMPNPDIRDHPNRKWPYELFGDVTYEVDFLHDVEVGDLVVNWVRLLKEDSTPKVLISDGYAFNGPSIPWGLRWLVPYKRLAVKPSLLHDALYQSARHGRLKKRHKKPADERFRQDLIAEGVPRWVARGYYLAVKLFGGSSYYGAPEPARNRRASPAT